MADSSERLAEQFASLQAVDKKLAPNFDTANTSGIEGDTADYAEWGKYAPPMLPVFWSFRLMMATGFVMAALAIIGMYATRGGRISTSKGLKNLALVSLPMPFLGAMFGWIMTEIGRQPFIVYPNQDAFDAAYQVNDGMEGLAGVYMLTGDGLSGVVSPVEFLISLVLFTVLYAALGVIWFLLLKRYAKEGINTPAADGGPVTASQDLNFGY